jgi:hypothetical protein
MVRETLAKSDSILVDVIDIFVTPDYISLMWDCIDHKIQHCWNKLETQLQWQIEHRGEGGRDRNHRVGIDSLYRAFSAENVFEIIDVDPKITPQYTTDYRVQYSEVPWQPVTDDPTEFICFLKKFPSEPIKPAGFFRGSSDSWNTTLDAISSYYNRASSTFTQWQEFGTNMPTSDNVRDYLTKICDNSFIPLKRELFGENIPIDNTTPIPPTTSRVKTPYGYIDFNQFDNQPIPRAKCNAHVPHHGFPKKNISPRTILSDPAAARTPQEAYELFLDKILNLQYDDATKDKLKEYLDNAKIPYAKSWDKKRLLDT